MTTENDNGHNDSHPDGRADWREAIWSVPRPFVFAYFALVTGIGWPALTYILWQAAPGVNAVWWRWPFELVIAAAPVGLSTGGGIAMYALLTVQGAAFLMVMYQFAMNRWVKPVIKRHKDAGREEGRQEGREEGIAIGLEEGLTLGREKAYQELQAWLQRKNAAESQGLPFDEPPPGAES